MKINDTVLIVQENAPYNSYNKIGIIIDYDKNDKMFLVLFGENNANKPYESWFRKEHLQKIITS